MEKKITNEIEFNNQKNYELGKYLYLGMALKNNKKVCIAVAYKLTYCVKKIDEFIQQDADLKLLHVSKIKTGELKACEKFQFKNPLTNYYL